MENLPKESRLILAIRAMDHDPKLTARGVAKIYTVPLTTLLRRRKGVTARAETSPNSMKLTELEEKTIVDYILDLDSRVYPPRLSKVRNIVN